MLIDGIQLTEGSTFSNATIATGDTYPTNANIGELFYKTGSGVGMKVYNGTAWTELAGGAGSVTSVAATVPSFLSVSGSPITSSGTLAITLSGTALPVANGGTGQTTASDAINALLPTQTSQSGKFLTTNGTAASWADISTNSLSGGGSAQVSSITLSSGSANAGGGITFVAGGGVNTPGDFLFTGGTGVAGSSFTVNAGPGGSGSAGGGGSITLVAGANGGVGGTAGNVLIQAGSSTAAPAAGNIILRAGQGTAAGGYLSIQSASTGTPVERLRILANGAWSVGSDGVSTGTSGQYLVSNGSGSAPSWSTFSLPSSVTVTTLSTATVRANAADSFGTSSTLAFTDPGTSPSGNAAGGALTITGGTSGTFGQGGAISITGGSSNQGTPGNVTILGGGANTTTGGNVTISGGTGSTAGGPLIFQTAPTTTRTERLRILANGAWSVGTNGTSTGSSGQVLTSQGSSSAPIWASPSVTALNGTGSASATISTSGLYAGMNGTFPLIDFINTSAATNQKRMQAYVNNSGAFKIDFVTDAGSSTTALQMNNTAGAPSATTITAAQIDLTGLTAGLRLNGSAGTTGQVITSNGAAAAPTWTTLTSASLSAANTWTATQTFNGSTNNPAVAFGAAYTETQVTPTLAAAFPIDCSLGNNFTVNLGATAITSINFTNVPASGRNYSATLYVNQDGTGGRSMALNSVSVAGAAKVIKWAGGSVPAVTSTASKTDVFTFVTSDGGNNWLGFVAGQNY